MNLPKAIELNKESIQSLAGHDFQDHADALKLGNAAIARLQLARSYGDKHTLQRLPGED